MLSAVWVFQLSESPTTAREYGLQIYTKKPVGDK